MKTNKKRTILILGLCLFAVAAIICAVLLLAEIPGYHLIMKSWIRVLFPVTNSAG